MKANQVEGAAVALIYHGKTSFYVLGVDAQTKRPITTTTPFKVGSITKLFTTLLLAQEIQAHRATLDSPISHYLPQFSQNSDLSGITLGELATYTSSLPFQLPEQVKTRGQLNHYYLAWRPDHLIGSRWQYSNVGIGLLGEILENMNDMDINTLYQTRIFHVLHMQGTKVIYPSLLPAAGALSSNIQDLSYFLAAAIGLPDIDENIHAAIYYAQIPRIQIGEIQQGLVWQIYPFDKQGKIAAVPEEMNVKPTSIKQLPIKQQQFNPNSLIDKTGAADNFRAYIALIPNQQSGVVVLINRQVSNGKIVNLGRKILFDSLKGD